jgi:hypothetical protein
MASTGAKGRVTIATIDISTDVVDIELDPNQEVLTQKTFNNGQHSAVSGLEYAGTITVVYDYTATTTGYRVLKAEAKAGTAAGVAFVWNPEGTASGNETVTGNIRVANPADAADTDALQVRQFPISFVAAPTFTTQ